MNRILQSTLILFSLLTSGVVIANGPWGGSNVLDTHTVRKFRALVQRDCNLVAAETPREGFDLFRDISHHFVTQVQDGRPRVPWIRLLDSPVINGIDGNVFGINFGYPHVSIFYGKFIDGEFQGKLFESWPIFDYRLSGINESPRNFEAGALLLARDVPDAFIQRVETNAESLVGKRKFSCAAGTCEVNRASGVQMPFFRMPSRMLRYFMKNPKLLIDGQEYNIEFFKTTSEPLESFANSARKQLLSDSHETIKKQLATAGLALSNYTVRPVVTVLSIAKEKIIGVSLKESLEEEDRGHTPRPEP